MNCGEKGNFVAGLNEGHKSSEVKWAVANNVFNFDGEDTGKQEAYGNAIPSAVDFADAAKGNFTLSALNAAFQRGIGDPRWLVPGEGSVLIKAKDGSDLTALLEEAAGDKIPNVVVIKLDKNATVTVSKPIVFANSLYIDVPESDILSPASATIDASGLEGPMITTPEETPEEWVTGSLFISDVKVKGLKNALFASAAKNYFYETFAIMGCVVEQAGDATTLDFTKGSVAKDLLISLSTFYAPTATTKSFYSSQSGQKATEYNEGIQQRLLRHLWKHHVQPRQGQELLLSPPEQPEVAGIQRAEQHLRQLRQERTGHQGHKRRPAGYQPDMDCGEQHLQLRRRGYQC